jgi:formylglycine-generating enzyme required for sulfatase activity
VHEVELSPCWISKYEMTQGQWERVLGANPSRWHPDGELQGVTLRHPVETVDWHEARRALAMLGLQLPSEAQWEYACRAGTTAPFSCAREELADHANLADRVYASIFRSTVVTGDWSDGFGGHAPVGSLAPNPWGLHDMHGNVWEWCLDGYREDSYQHAPPVDPVAPWQDTATRVYRGGSFNGTPIRARSAYRFYYSPSLADGDLGLRPAASLAPQVGDPRSAAAGGG